jgi:hypothetical protein
VDMHVYWMNVNEVSGVLGEARRRSSELDNHKHRTFCTSESGCAVKERDTATTESRMIVSH